MTVRYRLPSVEVRIDGERYRVSFDTGGNAKYVHQWSKTEGDVPEYLKYFYWLQVWNNNKGKTSRHYSHVIDAAKERLTL
jgi:sarcosine oxidase delta subunit